jgi:hypothetical protein
VIIRDSVSSGATSTAECEMYKAHLMSDLFRPFLSNSVYCWTIEFNCLPILLMLPPAFHSSHLVDFNVTTFYISTRILLIKYINTNSINWWVCLWRLKMFGKILLRSCRKLTCISTDLSLFANTQYCPFRYTALHY